MVRSLRRHLRVLPWSKPRARPRRDEATIANSTVVSTGLTFWCPILGDQFFINPEECIDCGACEPECPVEAIYPEDEVPEEMQSYIAKNADYFE
jgi:NAD-dependent dihydropyrimidine dehydrogenase PreA subunit